MVDEPFDFGAEMTEESGGVGCTHGDIDISSNFFEESATVEAVVE
jgi:hypothetical protein